MDRLAAAAAFLATPAAGSLQECRMVEAITKDHIGALPVEWRSAFSSCTWDEVRCRHHVV
jgi:hypothetical protein